MVEVAGIEIDQPVSEIRIFPSLRGERLRSFVSVQARRGIQGRPEARNDGTKAIHIPARLPALEGGRGGKRQAGGWNRDVSALPPQNPQQAQPGQLPSLLRRGALVWATVADDSTCGFGFDGEGFLVPSAQTPKSPDPDALLSS